MSTFLGYSLVPGQMLDVYVAAFLGGPWHGSHRDRVLTVESIILSYCRYFQGDIIWDTVSWCWSEWGCLLRLRWVLLWARRLCVKKALCWPQVLFVCWTHRAWAGAWASVLSPPGLLSWEVWELLIGCTFQSDASSARKYKCRGEHLLGSHHGVR